MIEESHTVSIGEVLADARHELGFTVAEVMLAATSALSPSLLALIPTR